MIDTLPACFWCYTLSVVQNGLPRTETALEACVGRNQLAYVRLFAYLLFTLCEEHLDGNVRMARLKHLGAQGLTSHRCSGHTQRPPLRHTRTGLYGHRPVGDEARLSPVVPAVEEPSSVTVNSLLWGVNVRT
ncbi:hypothetical protein EYF80_026529 [Liparis tanakae]|uniref:Uncharacterized protein n=1 Tax=Liparis tanakae TaxID=230148 RepID=A0A4Z2HBN3_9TELE|nr:hypothetical protein EYF80_026529 [Liparis tanakae]